MSTTEDQIVNHLRKLLSDRDEESRKRIADLERDLAHSRVKERQMEAEMAHLREQLTTALCALEEQPEPMPAPNAVSSTVDSGLSDPRAGKLLVVCIDEADAANLLDPDRLNFEFHRDQFVGWLRPSPG